MTDDHPDIDLRDDSVDYERCALDACRQPRYVHPLNLYSEHNPIIDHYFVAEGDR